MIGNSYFSNDVTGRIIDLKKLQTSPGIKQLIFLVFTNKMSRQDESSMITVALGRLLGTLFRCPIGPLDRAPEVTGRRG